MGGKSGKVKKFCIDIPRGIPYNSKAMWLDLRDVIEVPGASAPFETELDAEHLLTPSIRGFHNAPVRARGAVTNTAGLLALRAEICAEMDCVCDRCGTAFSHERVQKVDVPLSAEPEDEGESDVFPLDGDGIDVNEVLETCFILETESQILCRPDCAGLCPNCGRNLNEGPCGCQITPADPRLAVLGQLLDEQQE